MFFLSVQNIEVFFWGGGGGLNIDYLKNCINENLNVEFKWCYFWGREGAVIFGGRGVIFRGWGWIIFGDGRGGISGEGGGAYIRGGDLYSWGVYSGGYIVCLNPSKGQYFPNRTFYSNKSEEEQFT